MLIEYLSPRLNINTKVQQTRANDDEAQIKRLVTSVLIASLAVFHRLTFKEDHVIKDILENLLLHGNMMRKKCIEFEQLLRHFPRSQRFENLDIFYNLTLILGYFTTSHV